MAKISFMLPPNSAKHVRIRTSPNAFVQVEFRTSSSSKIFQVDTTLMLKTADCLADLESSIPLHLLEDLSHLDITVNARIGCYSHPSNIT